MLPLVRQMIIHDRYKKDYDHRPEKDAKGHFRDEFYYKGELHSIGLSEKEKKKRGLLCLGTGMLQLVLAALPGLIEHPSSHVLWVTLPYVCIFLPCFYYVFGALEFLGSGMELSRRQYDHSIGRMGNASLVIAITGIAAMLAELVWLIRHFDPAELFYMAAFVPLFPVLLTRPWKKLEDINAKRPEANDT
ncbi:MAG: hypothetical protein IKH46_07525 [Lachnospiraceae bacterium]|nr:hypothetical protein [Lachnospiraceae bacterium]